MDRKSCPYLGLREDPHTALNFASEGNACHKASPVAPIEIAHQEQYCLGPGYKACPIYQSVQTQPVPPMFAASSFLRDRRRRRMALIAVPFLVAGVVALGMAANELVGKFGLLGASRIPQTGMNQASMGLVNDPATLRPFFSPTAKATQTPSPNINCLHPDGWVPYIVAPTDSLYRLSAVYGVSVEELQKGNCMGEATVILPGNVIYVPFLPSATPTLTPTTTPTFTPTDTATQYYVQPSPVPQDQPSDKPIAPPPPTLSPQIAPSPVPPTNPPQPTAKPTAVKPPDQKPPEATKPPKTDKPPSKGGKDGKGKGGKH